MSTTSDEVSFVAKARSGGGAGTSILVTIPKHVVRLFNIRSGDYLQLKFVKKVGKARSKRGLGTNYRGER